MKEYPAHSTLLAGIAFVLALSVPSIYADHGQAPVGDAINGNGNGVFTGFYTHSASNHYWYTFDGISGDAISIMLSTAPATNGYEGYLWVYEVLDGSAQVGDIPGTDIILVASGGNDGNFNPSVNFVIANTNQYIIQVDSWLGSNFDFELTISGATGPVGPSDLITSAIPMNLALGQIAANIHTSATRGINSRLFRARGRTTEGAEATLADNASDPFSREVAASRSYRRERELKMETTIRLDGIDRQSATTTAGGSGPTTLNDSAPFLSVERPAGATIDPDAIASGENWLVYVSGNFGNVGLDNLGGNPGLKSHTYSSTLGFEYQVDDQLALGLGWSHIWNDNTMNGGLGSADLEGDAAIVYATYFKDNFWGDLLYSYGRYEADIRRNALGGTSVASPDIDAHQVSLNLGYNIEGNFSGTRFAGLTEGQNRVVHGPTLSIDYSAGTLDGYTETGNPVSDTIFAAQDYHSLITTIGWQATLTKVTSWGQIKPQFRLGYGRENLNQSTSVTGSLAANPLISATRTRISPGENWMEVGVGAALDFKDSNLALYLDYTGQYFREAAEVHYATLGAKVSF